MKVQARLVAAEVGLNRFGEYATGEQVMLLKQARALRPVRSAVASVYVPFMFSLLFISMAHSSSTGLSTDPFVWVFGCSVILYVVLDRIQAGWLPALYALEWSPTGLDARLLWWSDVIPPGTEVTVRFGLLVTAVRSPGGRWYPVPGEVFDRLVEARGEGE
jgi:hypothetical protein